MSDIPTTPRSEGGDAFRHGHPTASCGYADGSSRKVQWVTGWTEQQIEQRSIDLAVESAEGTAP